MKLLFLAFTHAVAVALGVALGIYLLPILIAPAAPTAAELADAAAASPFKGRFKRELADSDMFHWGEGELSVGPRAISLQGRIAPGPDYKLYLSPVFVETEAEFMRLKPQMVRVGDIKTFDNFVVPVPSGIDVAAYTTAIVWCETFKEFISAASYR